MSQNQFEKKEGAATSQQQSKVQTESLEQCMEKLRDVYMNYKDLAHRSLIDIKSVEKGERRVFYFKPETFLLEDPEKQRVHREKLLKKITAVPAPEPITYMGDELHRSLIESIQDRSQPTETRKILANFYQRKHYTLQHKKYKVLIRWAHHALTTEYMERIGHEATFKYGKIEYDMENAMNRFERLNGDDDFDAAPTWPRPNTKAKEGGSLYVENTDLEPVSAIRMDDVEVYLRQVTYDQKINKLTNKFLARLKWLPLYKRYEIWQDAVEGYNKLKENNLKSQEKLIQRVRQRTEEVFGKQNEDAMEELNELIKNNPFTKYKQRTVNKAEQLISSQKCDHQQAPQMIDNSIELKIHILDKSLEYGIYGDIELDQGYSFAYQITIFFPTYFQRQIIKSQFSVYDAFAGEEIDQHTIQKRNLTQMAKIDTNIFRDISTTKNNIPSQESLMQDQGFQNIKVIRLKAATWLDYVCVFPAISPHMQKQAAYLSTSNPIDSLLRSAINFLDVNDLATVNRILEETARLHQQSQKQKHSSKSKTKKSKVGRQDSFNGKSDKTTKPTMQNEASNVKSHFSSALRGDLSSDQKDPTKDLFNINKNSIRYMPQHLIHAYYILRHMQARDYKTQLLYCLNYFRSIQKRIMIDLREFGTRERILGDLTQPIIPSEEADKISQQNANANYYKKHTEAQLIQNAKSNLGVGSNLELDQQSQAQFGVDNENTKEKSYQIFDESYVKSEQNLVDMKKFKFKGKFNNKIFSTCPTMPRFHATFGEPVEHQPLNIEMERVGEVKHATDEGVKLMGRVDHVDIDEKSKEVYIKDDFGINIMYECALQDMKDLEEDILRIGSYYISKHEFLVNTENEKPYPHVDRLTLMEDLLLKERDFHFQKVILIQNYMECYEHINDPLEQQRLIQVIVDLMAQRPRLNLQATYFSDSYDAEVQCLMKHQELVRQLIYTQMMIEKEENKRMQVQLDMTYRIANDQVKGKWTYTDAEDFFNELKKRKALAGFASQSVEKSDSAKPLTVNTSEGQIKNAQSPNTNEDDISPTKRFLQKISSKQYGSSYQQQVKLALPGQQVMEIDSAHENGFAAVLGLPPITVESLYQQYKEKDEVILEIMNEQANYVRVYEGYPEFMVDIQKNQSSKLGNLQLTPWSLPINLLDFYDSLSFINKLYSTIQSVFTELTDILKPHDSTLLTLIETKIYERADIEFKKTKAFLEGSLVEFNGQEYLQDETIVGNADKMCFYAKDLVSHLDTAQKANVNPFYIGKLDIESINFFDFPTIIKDQHPFKKQKPQLAEDMDASVKMADSAVRPHAATFQRFFPSLKEYMRKINIPSMLHLYCNQVELLRLRQELIFALSESLLLQEVYESQCKLVNRQNYKVNFNDQINFDNYQIDQSKVNFIDDGAASFIDMDLAINEFDPLLKSNLNFRSPDAFKMLICPSGLEELRAVLHYQLMQKQLLIIGVRMNQLIIDTHMRALNELELIKKGFSVPNMIIKLPNILSKTGDGFSQDGFQKERQRYQTNLVNEAAQVFYPVSSRKVKLRNTVSKKFNVYLTSVTSTYGKVECSLRVLRAYKIKLLHSYCKEVMKEAYHDALKIQAVNSCQKLRTMTQLFSMDESISGMNSSNSSQDKPQIFKYEATEFFENFFASYNPSYIQESTNQHVFSKEGQNANMVVINPDKLEIVDYFTIPSTTTLAKFDTVSYDELRVLTNKHPSFEFRANVDDNDVESSIKEMIPKCTDIIPEYPKEDPDKERIALRVPDFQESYDYSQTNYAQIFHYYALLERIFTIEFFKSKIGSNLLDSLKLEHSIFNGLPFWGTEPNDDQSSQLGEQNESLAEKILNRLVAEKRAKINLADDMMSLSQTLYQLLSKIQFNNGQKSKEQHISSIMPKQKALEHLITYHEFRYFFILHSFEKLIDQYYQKGCAKEIKFLSEIHQSFTKRDNVRFTYKHNAFHTNLASITPQSFQLESQNLASYYCNIEEQSNFQRCVQPIVNEQAMNPPQLTIYEGMFLAPKFKTTQYSGQIPNNPKIYQPLETALMNLNEQERQYANSTVHSIKGFLKDYLEVIHKESVEGSEESYSLDQLRKCKKFLSELVQARQLKNALICWLANSTLPLDPTVYNQYLQLFKNDIFWKIMNQKDQLPQINALASAATQKLDTNKFEQSKKQNSNKEEGSNQKNKDDQKKAEQSMILSQQLQNMQSQVLIDQVQTCKAEIIVLSSEIERQIVKAAIQAVDSEATALAGCFSMSVKQIDMHIQPFQQFASTQYAKVDPNSHLDLVTKISEVQKFITKLRNRGTEVETLTSGPGMVFTIKDFNECLQMLCRSLIKYSERELRSRSEHLSKKETFYLQQLYIKDRRITNLEERINNTRENLDKLINSKMYEKGNQLIYELDSVNRQLRLFKDNVFALERELRLNIRAEFADTLRKNMREIDTTKNKFKDFKTDVTTKVKADLAQEQFKIEKILKKKAEEFKNLSTSTNRESSKLSGSSPGKHHESSSPISPSKGHKFFTTALQEINDLSEREARQELAQMWEAMRKLRIFWKTKEMITIDKYERELFAMKKQQTSNACLWEQLAEAEKREKVLKQELIFTQQSLAASEKVIEKLKDDLRKSESDRIRLNQYKTNKAQRLDELEGKVRKFEVLENINLEKLIDTLGSKEKQIEKLRDIEKNFNQRLDVVEKRKDMEIRDIKYQFSKEQNVKKDALERLENLRMELRVLEKNEGSMADVWKTKCKELVDVCNSLKGENDLLRQKIQIIAQNLSVGNENDQSYQEQSIQQKQNLGQGAANSIFLPKLMTGTSQQKMMGNIQASKYGSQSHTRQSSITKNDYSAGMSVERSLGGGMLDQSTVLNSASKQVSHQRGKSLFDGGPSQSILKDNPSTQRSNIFTSGVPQTKIKKENFAIFGQSAGLQGAAVAKGFSSVRTSQVGTKGSFKLNEDLQSFVNPGANQNKAIQEMSQTSTVFSKNVSGSANQTTKRKDILKQDQQVYSAIDSEDKSFQFGIGSSNQPTTRMEEVPDYKAKQQEGLQADKKQN